MSSHDTTPISSIPIEGKIMGTIHRIRGNHVILDEDLAELYSVDVKRLNEQVKRNIKRFPKSFMFRLNEEEYGILKSQFATSSWGGRRTLPYAFTEQGVAMLSAVLRSDTAIEVSIKIMDAFIEMRRFLMTNAMLFERMDQIESKQILNDKRIERILRAIDDGRGIRKQGIFFEGQIFDAHIFLSDLIKTASRSIIIIDNYIDEDLLILLSRRNEGVKVKILTGRIPKSLKVDQEKFNQQYPDLEIKKFDLSHDRFIQIDNDELYHFGASLKDLGKKWFAFSRMEIDPLELLSRLKEVLNEE